MSFLDRFKPQPKWKNPDPLIRAAGVSEIPDDELRTATLLELAAGDEDLRVRRAAASRLSGATSLLQLVRRERDEELKRELADRLVEVAIAPAATDGDAALALEGLEDQKQLATVARSSPHDTVRAAALGRVHDVKALGSVARHAVDPQTALDATARVSDIAELFSIAVKTDHKDAGIAALDRAAEAAPGSADLRETLDGVAARAKNKSVQKRARILIQAIDDAEAARRAALDAWRQRVLGVVARAEAAAAAPAGPASADQILDIEREWREVTGENGFEVDAETTARYGSLADNARAAVAAWERQEQERLAAERRRAEWIAARTSLVERIEQARGEDAPDEIARAREAWSALGEGEGAGDAAALAVRFEEACRQAERRHQNRAEILRIHVRLGELAAEAERLSNEETFQEGAWAAAVSEWQSHQALSDGLDPAVTAQYDAARARVQQRADERKAAAERALKQQVQRVEQLIERAQKRAAAEDLTLREADRISRDLRTAIETPPGVEPAELQALLERLRAAQALIGPKLHDLRELDEWKRFANAAVQEELIARTEALRVKYGFDTPEGPKEEDLEKVAQQLREVQERWKTVAEAPRAQAQTLWHRYRQAADPIQARVRDFFAHRAEERKGNLTKKLELIARAEALADSTDWIKTADELKKLQAEWQQIGAVPRQDTKETWKRFREACDRFFTRRNADLSERKEAWSANLAKKEAMCARAEELSASTEWDRGAAEIRRLQAEWKTIGPVRRNKSDAVWQRFRTACDTFFDRYKRRDEIDLQTRQADREALVSELESIAPVEGPAPEGLEPAAVLERVRVLRTKWNQSTPTVRHGADPLSGRFVAALERALSQCPDAFRGTEMDADANRQRMEKLCAKVESFATDTADVPANSSQALAAMLREALASNTIGGRAGEESKWRAMAEDVRQAQTSWSRLGPVPGEAGRALAERFQRACNRFFDQYRRKVPQQQTQQRGKPVGAR
jgi:hypothetical protein